jgi:hypothetical protein
VPMMRRTAKGGTESSNRQKRTRAMTKKQSKLNPFSFVNEINYSKKNIMVDQNGEPSDMLEQLYDPYLTNRSLSYFNDTVLYANEMNKNHHIDSALQNSFLLNTVRKRKRFSKWMNPNELEDLDVVKEYYDCSKEKARQALTLLTQNQINELKRRVCKGGYNNKQNESRGSSS